jgi:SRSO17 transposase
VPQDIEFATKAQIALQQLRTLLAEGAPHHCVLADAGYGVDTAFRQALSDMRLLYAVGGDLGGRGLGPPGVEPLPPEPYSGKGRPAVMPRRTAQLSVSALPGSLVEPRRVGIMTSGRIEIIAQ